jgi:TatD DNase family protein
LIIDTHSHLDHKKYIHDLDEVLENSRKAGVEKIVIPGADPKDLARAIDLAKKYKNIYFAVGIHPYHIEDWNGEEIFSHLSHKKCVAVGECGLDYYRLPENREDREKEISRQKDIFKKQIEIAKRFKKPLIVHIREASEDAKKILLENGADEIGGVLHCYNADQTLLELADKNFYFGIGGVVTFKNAKRLIDILPKIPLNKLVVETDAPYLTPHPHRGERNEPQYTKLVLEKISEILNIKFENMKKIAEENSRKLFQLDD